MTRMKHRPRFLGRALLSLFLSFSSISILGCGGPSGRDVVVSEDVVEDDLLAAGRSVRVEAEVEGDVAAAGEEVTVSAPVEGYVMSAGRRVTVDAPIGNDLWAAGERVNVDSRVGNNARIAGQTIEVARGVTIGHNARFAGAEVKTWGDVGNDLDIAAARTEIGGDIGGVVRARAERVTLLPDAVVHGDLIVQSPEPPVISPGAQVMGKIDHRTSSHAESRPRWSSWPLRWAGLFLSLLVLNLVAAAIAPRWAARVAETLRVHTAQSLLWGVLLVALAPIAIALLLVTLIGIPVAVVLMAAYIAALILSAAFVSYRVGLWLFARAHRVGVSRWAAMAIGALAVSLGVSLPFVGWAVALAVVLFGAGALAMERRERSMVAQPA